MSHFTLDPAGGLRLGAGGSVAAARRPGPRPSFSSRPLGAGLDAAAPGRRAVQGPTGVAGCPRERACDRLRARLRRSAVALAEAERAVTRKHQPGAAGSDSPGGCLRHADWLTRIPPAEATGSALSSARERGRPQRPAAARHRPRRGPFRASPTPVGPAPLGGRRWRSRRGPGRRAGRPFDSLRSLRIVPSKVEG